MKSLANSSKLVHRGGPSLVICGKDLEYGGKLDRISGLNIVNLTQLRSNICHRTKYFVQQSQTFDSKLG